MNDFFSINRYYKLLKKELTERSSVLIKIAGIFSLLIFGYWLSILLFNMQPLGINFRSNYIFFATFISMVIAPFNLYKDYNHSKRGIDYVMLPASVSEKFLSMTSITVIILPLIVFFSILLTDTILSAITPSIFTGNLISNLWNNEDLLSKVVNYLIIQQGCIFGNFLFRTNKIFKTLFTGAGLYIALALIMVFMLTVLFKEQMDTLSNMNTQIKVNKFSELINQGTSGELAGILKGVYNFAMVTIYGIFPTVFITGTIYKMKTQQY